MKTQINHGKDLLKLRTQQLNQLEKMVSDEYKKNNSQPINDILMKIRQFETEYKLKSLNLVNEKHVKENFNVKGLDQD